MKSNASSSQIQCWNCEESVHAYAARCPYCHKDLSPVSSDKIEQLPTPIIPLPSPVVSLHPEPEVEPSVLPEGFTVVISLAALLAGSFFLFFGIIIKLFSHNGLFILEWKASAWPYFVGSSFVLLLLGLFTLSKLPRE